MTPGAGPRPSRTRISLTSCHLSATLLSITLSGKHTYIRKATLEGQTAAAVRHSSLYGHTGAGTVTLTVFFGLFTRPFPAEMYPQMFFAVYRNSLVTSMNASSAKKSGVRAQTSRLHSLNWQQKSAHFLRTFKMSSQRKRSKLSMRRLILFGFKLHVNSRPLGKSHVRDTPLISDRDWDYYPLENTSQTTGIGLKKGHFTKESIVKGKGRLGVVNIIWI